MPRLHALVAVITMTSLAGVSVMAAPLHATSQPLMPSPVQEIRDGLTGDSYFRREMTDVPSVQLNRRVPGASQSTSSGNGKSPSLLQPFTSPKSSKSPADLKPSQSPADLKPSQSPTDLKPLQSPTGLEPSKTSPVRPSRHSVEENLKGTTQENPEEDSDDFLRSRTGLGEKTSQQRYPRIPGWEDPRNGKVSFPKVQRLEDNTAVPVEDPAKESDIFLA